MKHISYASSVAVFLGVLWAFWEAWVWSPWWLHILFGVIVLGSTALYIPAMHVVKVWAQWRMETGQLPEQQIAPPKRTRVRKEKVDA